MIATGEDGHGFKEAATSPLASTTMARNSSEVSVVSSQTQYTLRKVNTVCFSLCCVYMHVYEVSDVHNIYSSNLA